MAKRFTDSRIWNDPWYMDLAAKYKLFWRYICDQCDHAGVWKPNFKLATFCIGDEITAIDALKQMNYGKERVFISKSGNWVIRDFVLFQYPNGLKADNRCHNSIINILEKEGACKPLASPLQGRKDTDTDKDKDKDKEIPPKINDVIDHMKDEIEAKKFFVYYESNGWRVGRNPMKNWRAAATGWLARNVQKGTVGGKYYTPQQESTLRELAEMRDRRLADEAGIV